MGGLFIIPGISTLLICLFIYWLTFRTKRDVAPASDETTLAACSLTQSAYTYIDILFTIILLRHSTAMLATNKSTMSLKEFHQLLEIQINHWEYNCVALSRYEIHAYIINDQ